MSIPQNHNIERSSKNSETLYEDKNSSSGTNNCTTTSIQNSHLPQNTSRSEHQPQHEHKHQQQEHQQQHHLHQHHQQHHEQKQIHEGLQNDGEKLEQNLNLHDDNPDHNLISAGNESYKIGASLRSFIQSASDFLIFCYKLILGYPSSESYSPYANTSSNQRKQENTLGNVNSTFSNHYGCCYQFPSSIEKRMAMAPLEKHAFEDAVKILLNQSARSSTIKLNNESFFNDDHVHLSSPIRSTIMRLPPANCGVTHITHCHQDETWDCGIVCLQMILRWLNHIRTCGGGDEIESQKLSFINETITKHDSDFEKPQQRQLEHTQSRESQYGSSIPQTPEECLQKKWMINTIQTESIWTIDLVILIDKLFSRGNNFLCSEGFPHNLSHNLDSQQQQYYINYLFCSRELGVDESYYRIKYYEYNFRNDEIRVNKLFKYAKQMGLPTLKISHLDLSYVVEIVSRQNCVAIVLLNNRVLGNSQNNHRITLSKQNNEKFYSGHYVILCGVSYDKDDITKAESNCVNNHHKKYGHEPRDKYCMVIKNPGSKNATEFVTPKKFDSAWKSSGTDNDIIFLAIHENKTDQQG